MDILISHRYFWPDTPPYASMLRSIAEHLAGDGHDVTVFTAQPSYGDSRDHEARRRVESLGPIQVRRARLLAESKSDMAARAANLVLFSAQLGARILRQRPDAVMVATTPPILVSTTATVAARLVGAASVYHCQDIYPEVAVANKMLGAKRFTTRALRWLDAATMQRATAVVVLSGDMARTAARRGIADAKLVIINNFQPDRDHDRSAGPDDGDPLDPELRRRGPRAVFAGNLGDFQDLDAVVEAAALLADDGIEVLLLGDGSARDRLEKLAADRGADNVTFHGRVSQATAEAVVADSDAALVTLAPGVISAAYPSKTTTYLGVGTPLVVSADLDSELADVVAVHGLGRAVAAGSAEDLADAIRSVVTNDDAATALEQRIIGEGPEVLHA